VGEGCCWGESEGRNEECLYGCCKAEVRALAVLPFLRNVLVLNVFFYNVSVTRVLTFAVVRVNFSFDSLNSAGALCFGVVL
jgi:hypothetical protein